MLNDDMCGGYAGTSCGLNGTFKIEIGSSMDIQTGFLSKNVDVIQFADIIRAIYHEEQHIIQNCKSYYDITPTDDIVRMSIRNLASEKNISYYEGLNRYNNDLSEIEAEATALLNTYEYLNLHLPKANPETLICNLVNHKIQIADYFISGHYDSFDDILDAFSNHYEDAKKKQIEGYIAYALRPSQEISSKQDECIRYLQSCVKENPAEIILMEQFNKEKDPHKKDLMIASITCHLHPEIEYEKIFPCLSDIDLSPENIFDRSLPKTPDQFVMSISKQAIENRIQLANTIHQKIINAEYHSYDEKLKSDIQKIDETLVIKNMTKENTDD